MNKDLNYKNSGVDVEANDCWTDWIAKTVKLDRKKHGITHVGPIGGFAGAMSLPPQIIARIIDAFPAQQTFTREEVVKLFMSFSLVACTDGVGTKTMIAEKLNRLETLGYDLLAMNVNDMVAGGAVPLAFLDYIGCKGIMDDGAFRYQPFVEGLIKACREINVELLGGETAEMGSNYSPYGSDLTGFALGVVRDCDIPDNNKTEPGDLLLALPSSGIHSNGYSLVRKMLKHHNIGLQDTPKGLGGRTVADVLLTPTRLYVNQALAAAKTGLVKGMAHITGGGLWGNISRILPAAKSLGLQINEDMLFEQAVFRWIREQGVDTADMFKTFNMGWGFVFIVSPADARQVEQAVGEELFQIGTV